MYESFQAPDYRRQQIVEAAVGAANRIILDGSDGSEEETNYLTAEVARSFMETALMPFLAKMRKKDLK